MDKPSKNLIDWSVIGLERRVKSSKKNIEWHILKTSVKDLCLFIIRWTRFGPDTWSTNKSFSQFAFGSFPAFFCLYFNHIHTDFLFQSHSIECACTNKQRLGTRTMNALPKHFNCRNQLKTYNMIVKEWNRLLIRHWWLKYIKKKSENES